MAQNRRYQRQDPASKIIRKYWGKYGADEEALKAAIKEDLAQGDSELVHGMSEVRMKMSIPGEEEEAIRLVEEEGGQTLEDPKIQHARAWLNQIVQFADGVWVEYKMEHMR